MKDEEYEAQKSRILALIDKWVTPLGLRWWRLNFDYNRDGSGMEKDSPIERLAGRTFVNWRYLEATLEFNMSELAALDDERLEYVFVHELMHVLLHEMRSDEEGIDHEERVATTLARAFITVMDE